MILLDIHTFFASTSWLLLNVILMLRPLAVISKNIYLLKLMRYRRHLGILCGFSALIHVFLFLAGSGLLGVYLVDSRFWSLDNFYGWGSIALSLMLLPLVTSNNFSIKILKRRWRLVQQVTYLVYIATPIHITLASDDGVEALLPVLAWFVLWNWARHVTSRPRLVNDNMKDKN